MEIFVQLVWIFGLFIGICVAAFRQTKRAFVVAIAILVVADVIGTVGILTYVDDFLKEYPNAFALFQGLYLLVIGACAISLALKHEESAEKKPSSD